MRRSKLVGLASIGLVGSIVMLGGGNIVHAASNKDECGAEARASQTTVAEVVSAGDQKINCRLTSLREAQSKVTNATKLSANDKSQLTSDISAELNGLSALKTKLDAESDLSVVKSDYKRIFTDYRVHGLMLPKTRLIKAADSQQAKEDHLVTLASKLQTRLQTAQKDGKDTSAVEAKLADMTAKTNAAKAISPTVEQKVISLQPSDYKAQLQTARSDLKAATSDVKAASTSLKSLNAN